MVVGELLPPDKIEQLRKSFDEGLSALKAATKVGASYYMARKYYECFKAGNNSEPQDPLKAAEEKASRNRELKIERELMNDVASERSFRAYLESLVKDVIKPLSPPPEYKSPKINKNTVTETLLLHLSDWHGGEVVSSESVFGLNEFSSKILERRVNRIVNSVIEIKQRLEAGNYRFPKMVCSLNGDMVSGTIHEVERHSDSRNIIHAVETVGMLVAKGIRLLAAEHEEVHVFCTPGNHGRLPDAKKVQTKDPTRSWDYMIYTIAMIALQDCPNVFFHRPNSWAILFEVEGKLFYQGHGHFVKSWNSIPFYGLTRMTSRLGSVLSKHHRPVDYWLFAHFHVMGAIENAGGEYLINPCLIGPQEFGVHSMGDATAPGQSLFGVHPKHGITHRWRLNAEHEWPPVATEGLGTVKVKA